VDTHNQVPVLSTYAGFTVLAVFGGITQQRCSLSPLLLWPLVAKWRCWCVDRGLQSVVSRHPAVVLAVDIDIGEAATPQCHPGDGAYARKIEYSLCPNKNVHLSFFEYFSQKSAIFYDFRCTHLIFLNNCQKLTDFNKHTNSFCNFAYLKFHLACDVTIGYFRCIQFLKKKQ